MGRGRRCRPGISRLMLAAVAAGLLCACGTGSPQDAGTGATPSPQPPPATGTPGSSLDPLLLGASDLPEGYRLSQGESPGYRLTLCGVDLEPKPAVEVTSRRFAQSEIGPFVEQRVRRYDDESQAGVLTALREALRSCTSTSAIDPARPDAGTPMTVRPLDLRAYGEDSVAWHQEASGGRTVPTDVVLIRSGRTITLLTSYTFASRSDPGVIEQAAAAADALLGKAGT